MSRRKAREMALQTLFQLDYNEDAKKETALEAVISEQDGISEKAKFYAQELVGGANQHLQEIDGILAGLSADWKLDRMAGVDRNIARLAIYEMKFGAEKLPPNVVINEAVELAKKYGTEDSSRFINGILGSLVRERTMS